MDSIPPESNAAREFNEGVGRYLSGADPRAEALTKRLPDWHDNAERILPTLRENSLVEENIPTAEAVVVLCQIGREAITAPSQNRADAMKPNT